MLADGDGINAATDNFTTEAMWSLKSDVLRRIKEREKDVELQV